MQTQTDNAASASAHAKRGLTAAAALAGLAGVIHRLVTPEQFEEWREPRDRRH